MKPDKVFDIGPSAALPVMILSAAWVFVARGMTEGLYFVILIYFLSLIWSYYSNRYLWNKK